LPQGREKVRGGAVGPPGGGGPLLGHRGEGGWGGVGGGGGGEMGNVAVGTPTGT